MSGVTVIVLNSGGSNVPNYPGTAGVYELQSYGSSAAWVTPTIPNSSVISYTPATSADWPTAPTYVGPALDSLAKSTSVLVYNSGGSAIGNTYTSITAMLAAAATLSYVILDFPNGGTIPSGSYTMPPTWEILIGAKQTLTLSNGASFTTIPRAIRGQTVCTTNAVPPTLSPSLFVSNCNTTPFPASTPVGIIFDNVNIQNNGSAAFFDPATPDDITVALTWSNFLSGSAPILYSPNNSEIYIRATLSSTVAASTLSAGTGAIFAFSDSSSTVSSTQTGTFNAYSIGLPAAPASDGYYELEVSGSGTLSWTPANNSSGSTTLVNGVSPSITVFLTSTSRIVATYSNLNSSSAIGTLAALTSDRTTGTPGSFVIRSLNSSGGAVTGDQSTVEWHIIDSGN
jgi:hypothetical protein